MTLIRQAESLNSNIVGRCPTIWNRQIISRGILSVFQRIIVAPRDKSKLY